jgi:hypothetical protein
MITKKTITPTSVGTRKLKVFAKIAERVFKIGVPPIPYAAANIKDALYPPPPSLDVLTSAAYFSYRVKSR